MVCHQLAFLLDGRHSWCIPKWAHLAAVQLGFADWMGENFLHIKETRPLKIALTHCRLPSARPPTSAPCRMRHAILTAQRPMQHTRMVSWGNLQTFLVKQDMCLICAAEREHSRRHLPSLVYLLVHEPRDRQVSPASSPRVPGVWTVSEWMGLPRHGSVTLARMETALGSLMCRETGSSYPNATGHNDGTAASISCTPRC